MKESVNKAIELLVGLAVAAKQTNTDTLIGSWLQGSGVTTEELVRRAMDDDHDAHLFLCREAGGALANGKPMPRALEAYAANVLLNEFHEGKRGRGRPPEWMQNYVIVHALELLRIHGIPPTRNCATDPDLQCGSRILAEKLSAKGIKMGEAGVAKVWEKYGEKILAMGDVGNP